MNAIGWLGWIEPDTSDRPIGALGNGADLVVLPLLKVDLWIVPKNGHPCDAVHPVRSPWRSIVLAANCRGIRR